MKKVYALLLIITLLFLVTSIYALPHTALAQSTVVWSCSAMAAQPAGIPIRTNLHVSSHGTVRFRDGRTGTIALICPITDDLDGVRLRSLRLTYRDGDGRQGPSAVSASLRRVRRSDGHIATLPNGGVSSNHVSAPNSGPSGWVTHQSGSPGNTLDHVLDLENFYYYVQINLQRSDDAVPLGVMGVHLIN
jgi:hypothetical protein